MSHESPFAPPPRARATSLVTRRGTFAALDTVPDGTPRGTVLMLPGYTGSKEEFGPLLERFAGAGYRTVAVDSRGQYESEGPDDEAPYAQDALASDVLAQAEAAGSPVHLVGHSWGGHLARAAVLLDRGPFLSLTLMCSGPAEVNAGQQQRLKLLTDALATMTMSQVWDAMRALEPLDPALHDLAFLRGRWLRNNPRQLLVTGRQLAVEPDRVAELAAVRPLPKHVLSGEWDDKWPVALFDEMAVRLEATRTVVAGAGHAPNLERPADTATAMIAFWDRATG